MGANQVKIVDLLNQFELAGESALGVTVMRTHVLFQFPTAVTQDWEFGVLVGLKTQVGTQLPNPNGDTGADWMIYRKVPISYSGATVDAQVPFELDLRSKRKCTEMGQTVTLNLWASAINAGTVKVFARTLVAMP
jgi:hypothetical protein